MRNELVICDKKIENTDGTLEVTFGMLAAFEDMGINIYTLGAKPVKETTAYVAYVTGVSFAEASKLIDRHVKEGGAYNDVFECYVEALTESDFFQELQKEAEAILTEKKRKKK